MIAAPVLEHAGRGRVAGVVRGAAYVELDDGFVVALLPPGAPMLPNGLTVPALPARGAEIEIRGAPVWDPVPALRARPPLPGDPRVQPLADALAARDARAAAAAAEPLIGRGGGLTPEGDDVVAGALAVGAVLHGELPGVLPPDLRSRTTRLSATLLELAARGAVMAPVHGLLGPRWEAALSRLLRVGHSTGAAYAAGAGAALRAAPAVTRRTRAG